jgi:hypothetical protein
MIKTELTVRLQNSPGALARVCDVLASEAINVSAMMLDPSGVMRFVVDNPTHASGLLRERHYEVTERAVLFVQISHRAGAFASVARMLAAGGVNLDYVYVTVPDNQQTAAVVVGVPDAMRAASEAGL